jgi:predicted RNA-binding protein Jag
MNQVAEQQVEFEEETVAEAIESAEAETETEDDGFEIEVVDDTPEEDKGKPRRAEGVEPKIPNDEEIENYNENVQKRIKQLKYEFHEERRAKEEAARLQDEALRYAEQIKQENDRLKKTINDGEAVLVNQAKGRVDAQLEKAEAAYKSAYETGDADALIEAQKNIAKLSVEKDKYESYRPKPSPKAQPEPQYQQQTMQPTKPSQMGVDWAKDNPWFGPHSSEYDPEMTGYAFGVHEKLIKSGIAPDTEEYYNQIDDAVRRVFPDRFDDEPFEEPAPQRQAGNVVAPAARSGKKPRKVQLTSTQVSLAKRLGLTNEQYAAQLMKEVKR